VDPRRGPAAEEAKWIIGMVLPLALIGACVAGVTGGIGGFLIVMGLAASVWAASAFAKHYPNRQRRSEIRRSVALGITAYRQGEPRAVLRVHEFAVAEFRERIAQHRARTLG
jgi:hypothetical protein